MGQLNLVGFKKAEEYFTVCLNTFSAAQFIYLTWSSSPQSVAFQQQQQQQQKFIQQVRLCFLNLNLNLNGSITWLAGWMDGYTNTFT